MAKDRITVINDFKGGLNLTQSTEIKDNQFSVAKNFFYNKDKLLETRRGFTTFSDEIGADPVTSLFFFQRDDTLARTLVCHSGTVMYEYDNTSAWVSKKTGLTEYETIPGLTANRTRRDHAVYKNVMYMCNGVDQYASRDGTTYTEHTVGAGVTCTLDGTGNTVDKAAHGLSNGNEVRLTTTGTLPAELTVDQFYYIVNKNAGDFQVSKTIGGSAIDFTGNGTGTIQYEQSTEPRVRYVNAQTNAVFSSGDDSNPSTFYYTDDAPADGSNINQNSIIVGGDENGRINGMSGLGNIILAGKSNKVYSVDVSTPAVAAIDSQSGIFCDRSIANVGNSLVYFSDRGIDTLKARSGVSGSAALESTPLGDDVRQLTSLVTALQYNSGAAWYIKPLNNYYFAFDTTNDNIPDTVLVYNSAVSAWTQYTLPNIYDFSDYVDGSQVIQYLFASANGGQVYQFETGYDDDGIDIEYELETKRFDFGTPGLNKTFDFVDVVGLKSEGTDIDVDLKVDGEVTTSSTITDDNVDLYSIVKVVGETPIGDSPLTGGDASTDVPLYRFTFRVPLYSTGSDIAVNMSSTGGIRILEKMRISRDDEPIEVFGIDNIG